ncbi:MAG: hypothetical protein HY660_16290, partial [Armatimonadetes bacterium]|nr:hypothetical protein [Armatimonadota bacterium]
GKAADTFPTALHLRAHVGPDREAAYQETAAFLKAYYGQEYTRQHLETQCAIGTPEECVEKFRAYANAGCGTIIIRLLSWNLREQLQRWITQVLPQVVG